MWEVLAAGVGAPPEGLDAGYGREQSLSLRSPVVDDAN